MKLLQMDRWVARSNRARRKSRNSNRCRLQPAERQTISTSMSVKLETRMIEESVYTTRTLFSLSFSLPFSHDETLKEFHSFLRVFYCIGWAESVYRTSNNEEEWFFALLVVVVEWGRGFSRQRLMMVIRFESTKCWQTETCVRDGKRIITSRKDGSLWMVWKQRWVWKSMRMII